MLSPLTVEPGHLDALTFGTCTYSFQNNSYDTLEYCWIDVVSFSQQVVVPCITSVLQSIQASEAASACFPPVQPFYSHGFCSAFDYSWSVGCAFSISVGCLTSIECLSFSAAHS